MSIQCHACIGGTNVGEDIRKLDYGQHIVSGTPGRVFGTTKILVLLYLFTSFPVSHYVTTMPPSDMIKRRNLRTRAIKMLVLDEADEMLNKGICCPHAGAIGGSMFWWKQKLMASLLHFSCSQTPTSCTRIQGTDL